jgi:hypothetical protein
LTEHGDAGRERGRVWFLTIHQPKVQTLVHLTTIQKNRFVIHEVHLAVDFACVDRRQSALATEFLRRHAVQKWRRRGRESRLVENTAYWSTEKAARRNIALYGDRESKTGLGACCHFEMRFKGAGACKRAGVSELGDLIGGLHIMPLLERQTKLASIDPKRLNSKVEKRVRQIVLNGQRQGKQVDFAATKKTYLILLERLLADEGHIYGKNCDSIARVRSQCLRDQRPRYRSCLIRMSWSQFTPPPRWHHWR